MRTFRLLCSLGAVLALAACGASNSGLPAQPPGLHATFPAAAALPTQHIYVGQGDYYGKVPGAILVYSVGAKGNVAPVRSIAGNRTMLQQPRGIGLDSKGRLYAINQGTNPSKFPWQNKIFIFGPSGQGNIAPAATMSGLLNSTTNPLGLYLDAKDNVYVVRTGTPCACIDAYQAGVWPKATRVRYIKGSPYDIIVGGAFDSAGQFYVGVNNEQASLRNGAVAVFGPKGNNVNPVRYINGYNADLYRGINQVAVDGDLGGRILVNDGAEILIFPIGANGDVYPSAKIAPTDSKLPHLSPAGVAVDRNHNIYVLDAGDNAILEFPPNASGIVAPSAIIQGPLTKLNAPQTLAIL